MAGNSFGKIFRLTTFGESHNEAIGGVIDGCPAGVQLNLQEIQNQLDRRKPGQSPIVSQRKETDQVKFLSGIFQGKTTGTPIGFLIENTDPKSHDYSHLENAFRPSHADYTYHCKYGHYDYRGGGRSSARETACRVVAGAIARQLIPQVKITAYVSAVGEISLEENYQNLDFSNIEKTSVRCPDLQIAQQMENKIKQVRKQGDTIGGIISCVVQNVPHGLGEPVFDRLSAELGKAMLSINAVKGFEFGSGFEGTKMLGSEHNDKFNTNFTTQTNFSGGIQGGISNAMDIHFRVAFKPVATLMQPQNTINKQGEPIILPPKGRHDPCVLPRAVPIVEAMTALVMADYFLIQRTNQL